MPLRQVEINGGLLEIAVAQQHLNRPQIGPGLQQVSSEAVPQSVRMKWFANAGALGGFAAGVPDNLGGDGIFSGGVPATSWEQPLGWFPAQPAVMLAQFLQQMPG